MRNGSFRRKDTGWPGRCLLMICPSDVSRLKTTQTVMCCMAAGIMMHAQAAQPSKLLLTTTFIVFHPSRSF